MAVTNDPATAPPPGHRAEKIRNLAAFWLLGLSSSYSYVVMLSAAYDILDEDTAPIGGGPHPTNGTSAGKFECNHLSTGAILLADILPDMMIAVTAPWYAHVIPYGVRIAMCVVAAVVSYLIVALSHLQALSLLGIVFSSIAGGIGEFTCVSLMSFYDKNVVSTWSSGTGAAGLFGSLFYAGLTEAGLSTRDSLLVQIVVPLVIVVSYWGILVKVPTSKPVPKEEPLEEDRERLIEHDPFRGEEKEPEKRHLTLGERFHHMKHLMKYIIPLWMVYFCAYFINHGLLELIFVRGIPLTHESQYRWFQVSYQLGVFISRSSVNIVTFKRLWVFPILQWSILVAILTGTCFNYMPSILVIFAIIFMEGLIGGASYVNTFYQIRKNEDPKYKEFAMGATASSESSGIVLAGIIAMPVHDALCRL